MSMYEHALQLPIITLESIRSLFPHPTQGSCLSKGIHAYIAPAKEMHFQDRRT